MEQIKSWVRWGWRNLSNFALLVGWALTFALPAWAVSATEAFNQNQPLSWVVAGFAGMAAAAIIYWVAGASRSLWVSAGIKSRFYRQNDRFNPMDTVFERQRIALADLVHPLEQVVKNKKFIDCEIVGPSDILLFLNTKGASRFTGNNFSHGDAIEINDDSIPQNATGFVDCDFEDCRFYKVNLLFQSKAVGLANAMVRNLRWVTPVTPARLIDATTVEGATNEGDTQPEIRGPVGDDGKGEKS